MKKNGSGVRFASEEQKRTRWKNDFLWCCISSVKLTLNRGERERERERERKDD